MKSYNHFSEKERFFIEIAFNIEHKSIREIAKNLGKSPSSVSREIKRNSFNGKYIAQYANSLSKERTWHSHSMYLFKYNEFTNLFLKLFDKRCCGVYSTMFFIKRDHPDIKTPSVRQTYRWINSDRWIIKRNDRLRRVYKKGRKRQLGIFSTINSLYVKPIWVRPKVIDLRLEFGHWEADLILGKQCNNYKNILTLSERKTRILYACFVKNKFAWTINNYLKKLIKDNELFVKSITIDNGVEFERIGIFAKHTGITIYTCDPYASFQRGTNENLNGFIRRYWRKGTDFNSYTDQDLERILNEINSMPRKIFDMKSSKYMYEKEKSRLLDDLLEKH